MSADQDNFSFNIQKDNLSRAIHWTNIADSKANIIIAFCIALASLLFSLIEANYEQNILYTISVIGTLFLLCMTMFFVFKIICPSVSSDYRSAFFFIDIAKMDFADFKERAEETKEEQYADLISQVHRVSVIAKIKYKNLNSAFIWLYFSIAAWFTTIILINLFGGDV